MHTRRERWIRTLAVLILLAGIAGCAARRSYTTGERAMRRENYDDAVLNLSKAVALDPGNARYSVALSRAKVNASNEHFQKGKRFQAAGQLELAYTEYQQALMLDPGHQFAQNELQKVVNELERIQAEPSAIEAMKEQARRRDLGPPKLDPRANIDILLNFNDVKVGKIFEAIGKASGINFIFDDKVELDKPMTIDIGNVTLEKALDILMLQTKNFYKPLDEYTLLVAPDNRQKRQEYDDQVIRTFFLSNADTKQVVTLLRSLLQARQVAENSDLNSVTIKDSPDKVAIAERIIAANDKSRGEVLIDVELLEINRTTAETLGIDLSSKTFSLTFQDGGASLPLNNLKQIDQTGNWSLGPVPSVVLNLLRSDADTRLIAKPQLRVSEGEQAEILIGDRVPIPTTSFNTSQTIGGNIVPITSFTYQNVGITVQIEPRVHHNREVTLRVQVEISQVGGVVETGGGQSQPIIGTRQIQTVIRLKDGETNMLAGLIQRTNNDSYSGLPGLSNIPGLRRIFGTSTKNGTETDIILTIKPRIIRIPDITEQDLQTMWVGTEENMQLRGPTRAALNQGPFGSSEEIPRPVLPGSDDEVPTTPTGRRGGSLARIQSPDSAADFGEFDPDDTRGGDGSGFDPSDQSGFPPSGDGFDPAADDGSAFGDDEPGEDEPIGLSLVRLIPSAGSYGVGQTVAVQVVLENGTNVGSVPFHLRYNKNVLQFVPPALEGALLNSDGTNTVFLASDTGGGGDVVVGLSRLGGGTGVSGSGTLATFQFLAVAPGDAGFAFTGASVKDPQARNLPSQFATVPVKVAP